MKAPIGEIVSLYYDSPRKVSVGDVLKTATTGRLYVIVELRKQEKGMHVGRWHIKGLVADRSYLQTLPPGKKIHIIKWYPRGKRK